MRVGASLALPVVLMLLAVATPAIVGVVLPGATGDSLVDGDLKPALDAARAVWPELETLEIEAAAQALVFSQFLTLLVLVPISGAVAAAAYGLVGERVDKALEPLLATPITTGELLVAKALGAFLPALAVEAVGVVVYALTVALMARPGVLAALMAPRGLVLVGVIGPIVTLLALQLTLLASTRTADPRTAQQLGSLTVLPLTALMVAQFAGTLWLSTAELVGAALVLLGLWAALVRVSVAVFDRERVLVRWK